MAFVSLNPTKDAHIREEAPTTNSGSDQLDCGEYNAGSEKRRPLLGFDIMTQVPDLVGATITLAQFKIYDSGSDLTDNTRTVRLYRLERQWTENGVTWNTTNGSTSWTTAGASNPGGDRDNSELGNFSQPNPPVAGYKTITLDTALVQGWVDGAHPDYGFMMISEGENNDMHRYVSREGAGGSAGQEPILELTYTPAPSGGNPMMFQGGGIAIG
jgi:hypothetical protein